jgi:hypothetical protein
VVVERRRDDVDDSERNNVVWLCHEKERSPGAFPFYLSAADGRRVSCSVSDSRRFVRLSRMSCPRLRFLLSTLPDSGLRRGRSCLWSSRRRRSLPVDYLVNGRASQPSYGRKERPRARLSLCLVIVIVCVACTVHAPRGAFRVACLLPRRRLYFALWSSTLIPWKGRARKEQASHCRLRSAPLRVQAPDLLCWINESNTAT